MNGRISHTKRYDTHYFLDFLKKRSMDDTTFPLFMNDLLSGVGFYGKMTTAQNNEARISCFHLNQESKLFILEGTIQVKKIKS